MARSELHEYVAGKGPMTLKNPEILRLSKATGFSSEHLFRVVIGQRVPAEKCAIALVGALKGRLPITVETLLEEVPTP